MTTWPAEAPATNEGLSWREARYLARVVQMLVTSPNDREEFRRELEHLLRAAEALRGASARRRGRAGQAADTDLGVTIAIFRISRVATPGVHCEAEMEIGHRGRGGRAVALELRRL